jgi:hypothetical protein
MQISISIVVWAATFALVLLFAPRTDQRRIDCEQVEFHPDYTPKMKQQCRDRIKV